VSDTERIAPGEVLTRLMRVIESRAGGRPEESYTAALLAGGVEVIGEKVVEEAAEVVAAAEQTGAEDQHQLVREVADLIYHLLVLLAARGASLSDVQEELARRFGVSGHDEKASREK
jgi:phosphoribosyl-ATP pyrophosphohydrolase